MVSEPARFTGGLVSFVNLSNSTFTVNADEYLFVNLAGTVVYRKRNNNPTYALDNGPVFHTLRDGNILVGRRQKRCKISTVPTTAGDMLWCTVVPPQFTYREWDARDMAEDVDDNLLLVGDSDFSSLGGGSSRQIHLVRFTGRGVLVQDLRRRRAGDNFARSAILDPTGRDPIFSGSLTAGIIGGEDLFLARYTGYRPLATVPGLVSSPHLGLYPNPAGSRPPVWAELSDRRGGTLRVFDTVGSGAAAWRRWPWRRCRRAGTCCATRRPGAARPPRPACYGSRAFLGGALVGLAEPVRRIISWLC